MARHGWATAGLSHQTLKMSLTCILTFFKTWVMEFSISTKCQEQELSHPQNQHRPFRHSVFLWKPIFQAESLAGSCRSILFLGMAISVSENVGCAPTSMAIYCGKWWSTIKENCWLVVEPTPLKNMSSSVGIIATNIYIYIYIYI